ncbi:MAG: hypothetical protein A3E84_04035 [Gammaproteobacteria bacterium RIFCSPHIGHO2_12_FULL_42_13]|nr:MAG: hypothetical protein A3E84_04035 [Gammaproteobacteria bacterium RIFCSPHIGHO2_12_FULL_42_13]
MSLRRIESLCRIETVPEGLRIGAGCVIAQIWADKLATSIPLLGKMARAFGTRQVRNRATVGGNIASGLPDRTLAVCLLALDASVHLKSLKGERIVPLEKFLVGAKKTALTPEEMVIAVTIPQVKGFQDYNMIGPRNAQFFVTVSMALVVDDTNKKVHLALGNAGPIALRAHLAEDFANTAIDWKKQQVNAATAAEFGEIAAKNCNPPSDATAGENYRRHAIKIMARRLLIKAFEEEPR